MSIDQKTKGFLEFEIVINVLIRGLVKKSKNPRKTRIGQTPNTRPPIHFFFLTFENMKTTRKTLKKHKISKKKKIRVGA